MVSRTCWNIHSSAPPTVREIFLAPKVQLTIGHAINDTAQPTCLYTKPSRRPKTFANDITLRQVHTVTNTVLYQVRSHPLSPRTDTMAPTALRWFISLFEELLSRNSHYELHGSLSQKSLRFLFPIFRALFLLEVLYPFWIAVLVLRLSERSTENLLFGCKATDYSVFNN